MNLPLLSFPLPLRTTVCEAEFVIPEREGGPDVLSLVRSYPTARSSWRASAVQRPDLPKTS